jgi:transcriptional regulator with XRE-family HTH domain
MTGVSKNTISDIETGQKFARASTLANLAEVFETDVYELLKPDDVVSDKAMDIIVNYIGKMRNAVSEIEESFLRKMSG